jgi:hypothetical protein
VGRVTPFLNIYYYFGEHMKVLFLTVLALLSGFNVFGNDTPSQTMQQFCSDRNSPDFVKDLTNNPRNLMGFENSGGIANGGVCWWHSRFQRNALYLTIFHPEEYRPTQSRVLKIIKKIRSGDEVVEIPGFSNFNDFSATYKHEIQKELNKWQKNDGVTKFNWVVGLSGESVSTPKKMKEMMDELYQYVEVEGNIAYQKLQIKGIIAHAWLVVKMKPYYKDGYRDGYDLKIIESNYPSITMTYQYREGQTSFIYSHFGSFTPYLERKSELSKMKGVIAKRCNQLLKYNN